MRLSLYTKDACTIVCGETCSYGALLCKCVGKLYHNRIVCSKCFHSVAVCILLIIIIIFKIIWGVGYKSRQFSRDAGMQLYLLIYAHVHMKPTKFEQLSQNAIVYKESKTFSQMKNNEIVCTNIWTSKVFSRKSWKDK